MLVVSNSLNQKGKVGDRRSHATSDLIATSARAGPDSGTIVLSECASHPTNRDCPTRVDFLIVSNLVLSSGGRLFF